jgi:hypothetical protein
VGVSSDGVVVAHARLSIVDDEAAQGLLLESGAPHKIPRLLDFSRLTCIKSCCIEGLERQGHWSGYNGRSRTLCGQVRLVVSLCMFSCCTQSTHSNLLCRRGYSTLYLSTHDQQGFYARLGFEECEPVTSLGDNSSRISKAQLANLLSAFGGKGASQTKDKTWMKKGAVLS